MNEDVEHKFTVRDADGAEVEYRVVPHAASEGLEVTLKLAALAAEPLGRLADSVFSGDSLKQLQTLSASALLDSPEILSGIDFAALGKDVRNAVVQSATGIPSLVRAILKHTLRNGKPLDKNAHFDDAFTRNYAELFVAVFKVVAVNRFLPLTAISDLAGRG